MRDEPAPVRRIPLGSAGCSCLLVGLGIVAVSGFLLAALLGGGKVRVNGRPGQPSDAWLPGIFAAVGLALAGVRWRSELDLDDPAEVDEYGWFLCRWTRRKPLGALQRVEIGAPETRGSGKNRRTVHPVRVVGADRAHEVEAPREVLAARRAGERFARLAVLPLHDRSSGDETVRPPDQLDLPYVERMDDADLAVPPPAQPRAVLAEAEGGVVITIASSAAAVARQVVVIGVLLVIAGFIIGGLSPWVWLGLGCVAVLTALVAAALHRSGFLATRVVVGRAGIRVGRAALATAEVEEVVVASANGPLRLRVISDRRMLEFGEGLAEDELRFLRAVALRAMRGR